VRFVADENLNGAITRGIIRLTSSLDLVRVQDVGLSGVSDPQLLAWAAHEGRIVLSHDVTTLRKFAENRVRSNLVMPGLIVIGEHLPVRSVIDDLMLIVECSLDREWDNQIVFLPLR